MSKRHDEVIRMSTRDKQELSYLLQICDEISIQERPGNCQMHLSLKTKYMILTRFKIFDTKFTLNQM